MSDAAIEQDILSILAGKGRVDPEKLTPEARLSDLGIASLDVIEIVFALEDRFDITIPFNANDSATEFDTVGDMVRAVRAAVAGSAA